MAVEQDSILVESPLPSGAAAVARFLFQVPQWFQIAGAIVGVVFAAVVAFYAWRRRATIIAWVLSRSNAVKWSLAAVVLLTIIGGGGTGAVSWNYMQHDNDFCMGCHVMDPAFQRFTASEHDSLSCHDCHQQSIFASTRQLYLWVVERPEEIGSHAPVPNAICERCHVTGQPETWQHIAATAGHRTHLESDSTVLRDVMCVTCHGVEVHRFVPVDQTCAQSDCHVDATISLGKMQQQTALHCTMCHEFVAEVPALATRDSAAATLVPNMDQCLSCHAMQEALARFDPMLDPHNGTCGMCHNPHEQAVASEAAATCATANCHADWRTEPFHVGPRHLDVGSQCIVCHEPHRAAVDASDCEGCHALVLEREGVPEEVLRKLRGAAPFDTTRALGRVGNSPGRGPPPELYSRPVRLSGQHVVGFLGWSATAQESLAVGQDSFPHEPHDEMACLTCHTAVTGHGGLTFEAPRGCQICHHQAPTDAGCASCHDAEEIAAPETARVSVKTGEHEARTREVDFYHDAHEPVGCVTCHVGSVNLTVPTESATCVNCHEDHHTAARDCAACHVGEDFREPHAPPVDAHAACDACHTVATIQALTPDRPFCLACHQEQLEHYPARECTPCHLQASPEGYRGQLLRPGG